jgi:hypothetical protein
LIKDKKVLLLENTPGRVGKLDRRPEKHYYLKAIQNYIQSLGKNDQPLLIFDGFYSGLDVQCMEYIQSINKKRSTDQKIKILVMTGLIEKMEKTQLPAKFKDWDYLYYHPSAAHRQKQIKESLPDAQLKVVDGNHF